MKQRQMGYRMTMGYEDRGLIFKKINDWHLFLC